MRGRAERLSLPHRVAAPRRDVAGPRPSSGQARTRRGSCPLIGRIRRAVEPLCHNASSIKDFLPGPLLEGVGRTLLLRCCTVAASLLRRCFMARGFVHTLFSYLWGIGNVSRKEKLPRRVGVHTKAASGPDDTPPHDACTVLPEKARPARPPRWNRRLGGKSEAPATPTACHRTIGRPSGPTRCSCRHSSWSAGLQHGLEAPPGPSAVLAEVPVRIEIQSLPPGGPLIQDTQGLGFARSL